jgi:hypothetical protein
MVSDVLTEIADLEPPKETPWSSERENHRPLSPRDDLPQHLRKPAPNPLREGTKLGGKDPDPEFGDPRGKHPPRLQILLLGGVFLHREEGVSVPGVQW